MSDSENSQKSKNEGDFKGSGDQPGLDRSRLKVKELSEIRKLSDREVLDLHEKMLLGDKAFHAKYSEDQIDLLSERFLQILVANVTNLTKFKK